MGTVKLSAVLAKTTGNTGRMVRVMEKTYSSRWVLCGLIATALFACSRPEDKTRLRQAQLQLGAGSIAISGHIRTSGGLPIVGTTVVLAGSKSASVQSDAAGAYQFIGLQTGSYSVRATSSLCQFTPDVVNLNNLATSTTQDFVGSGPNCHGGGGAGGSGGSGGIGGAGGASACDSQQTPEGEAVTTSGSLPVDGFGTLSFQATLTLGTVTRNQVEIRLNNSPLIRFQTDATGTDALVVHDSIMYFAPITGVQQSSGTFQNGLVSAVVDGRSIVPAPLGTPPNGITFADGGPPPTLNIDPRLQHGVEEIFELAHEQIEPCLATRLQGASPGTAAAAAAALDPPGHLSATQRNGTCRGCRISCHTAFATCAYTAYSVSLLCGPFAILCGVGSTVACYEVELFCLGLCNTTDICCPVDCGGHRQAVTTEPVDLLPTVGCCFSGETCLDRSRALCCSSGNPPCGTSCCDPGAQCAPTVPNGTPSICCSPASIGRLGNCCLFGRCSSNADCPASSCGADGCCTLG